jgi:hypothetical protein
LLAVRHPAQQSGSQLSELCNSSFRHSGLDPESSFFPHFTPLDAGSVIPDLIRDRHDGRLLSIFLNYTTGWQAGVQETQCFLDSRLRGNDKCR